MVCFRSRKSFSQPKPPKKQTNSSRKKFFIFYVMELSSFNIKKILYFQKWNTALFGLNPQNFSLKKPALKKFLIFSYISRNRNLEKKFFFQETKLSYILGNESFLYFRKRNFLIFQIGIFRTLAYLELHSNLSIVDICGSWKKFPL